MAVWTLYLRILLTEMLLRERMVGLRSTVPQGPASNCAVPGHGKGRQKVKSVKMAPLHFFLQTCDGRVALDQFQFFPCFLALKF